MYPQPWQSVNLNQQSVVRTFAHMCARHFAQLLYTIDRTSVLIIFPHILQTVVIVQLLSLRGGCRLVLVLLYRLVILLINCTSVTPGLFYGVVCICPRDLLFKINI